MNIHIKQIIIVLLLPVICWSAEYDVGGGGSDYATLTALTGDAELTLSAGDIVNVYPGAYTDEPTFGSRHVGSDGNPILIRGVSSEGTALTSVAADNSSANPVYDYTSADSERTEGHFYLNETCAWIEVSGLAFKNLPYNLGRWQVIRVKGDNITIEYCLFKNNYGAIGSVSTSNKLNIEHCIFEGDNYGGSGHPHLVYGIGQDLTVKFSYFYGFAGAGPSSHIIKTRDCSATVNYNYFIADQSDQLDEIVEFAQAEVGQSCGAQPGQFIGNVLVVGVGANLRDYIKFSSDAGAVARFGNFTVINNTFANLGSDDPHLANIILDGGYALEFSNNIVYNVDHFFAEEATSCTLAGYNNILPVGMDLYNDSGVISGLNGTISDSDPEFVSVAHGDTGFTLELTSPAVNAGYESISVTPTFEYIATADSQARPEIGTIDIGAYEYYSPDTTPPTVTAFAIPATYTSIPVPVESFTATDDVGVTGYIVTASAVAPAYTESGWTPSPTTALDFFNEGANTGYAWAKDAAGNVSTSATDYCTVTLPEPGITWEVQPTWSVTWEDQPTWGITWE